MKNVILLALIGLILGKADAQTVYLKLTGGYQTGVNSDYFYLYSIESSPVNEDSLSIYYKNICVPYSLGKGGVYGGSVGLVINNYLDVEVAVTYNHFKKQKFRIDSEMELWDFYFIRLTYDALFNTKNLSIVPAIHLKFPVNFHYIYSTFGFPVSMISMTENVAIVYYTNLPQYYPSTPINKTKEYSERTSFGFSAGVGFEFYLGENFYTFAEVSYTAQRYVPESSHFTKYDIMGDDQLAGMDINEKEFVYVDEYSDIENSNPYNPRKITYISYPFDNIAFRVGIKLGIYQFSKKKTKE
jgi:hypothetical protein